MTGLKGHTVEELARSGWKLRKIRKITKAGIAISKLLSYTLSSFIMKAIDWYINSCNLTKIRLSRIPQLVEVEL